MKPSLLIIIAVAGIAMPPLQAQRKPTFARLWPGNFVEILDLKRNHWRRVHQSPAWSINNLSVSPTGERLAYLAWTEGVVKGHDYVRVPSSELIVIDTSGNVLAPGIRQVQRYAWCGAACIVYITGLYEDSHWNFQPWGIGLLDLRTGVNTSLPGPPTPRGITWASFDSGVYIKNRPGQGEALIYRLDLATLALQPTELHDHVFSPTGRYYLHDGEWTDTLVVYETRTNRPVDLESFRREGIIISWVSPREDVLLAVRRPPPRPPPVGRPRLSVKKPGDDEKPVLYKLYDLSTGQIVGTVMGYLGRWVGPLYAHLLGRGEGYEAVGIR